MIDERDLLERELHRFEPQPGLTDRIHRRREQKRRNQRIRAGVLGLAIAIAVGWLGVNAIRSTPSVPADDPTPTPTPTDGVLRRHSEVLQFSRGELVAADPHSGETRVIIAANKIPAGRKSAAAWSTDGRWVALDVARALWVVNGEREPRAEREPRQVAVNPGPWVWSPTTAQLAIERGSADGDSLILIDAATGDMADLGPVVGDLTTLAWSPDGTQIAYGTMPSGSVYVLNVEDGSSRLLAEDVGYTYGIGGSTIHWSPDGAHVAIAGAAEAGPYRLYLMDADGSGLRAIEDYVQDVAWSPDGARLAFATFTGPTPERVLRIWTLLPDDPAPFLVHEEPSFGYYETADLAWSPDDSRIAYTTLTANWEIIHKVVAADGAVDALAIDELAHLSWGDGSYFCACYG